MATVQMLVSFVVVLGILIIVHEFGHFIMARLCGVGVERFSVGFGPVLWRYRGKETEYCLSADPDGRLREDDGRRREPAGGRQGGHGGSGQGLQQQAARGPVPHRLRGARDELRAGRPHRRRDVHAHRPAGGARRGGARDRGRARRAGRAPDRRPHHRGGRQAGAVLGGPGPRGPGRHRSPARGDGAGARRRAAQGRPDPGAGQAQGSLRRRPDRVGDRRLAVPGARHRRRHPGRSRRAGGAQGGRRGGRARGAAGHVLGRAGREDPPARGPADPARGQARDRDVRRSR